jgi:hypothetical protein
MKLIPLAFLMFFSLFACASKQENVYQKQDFHYALDALYPELRESLYRQTRLPYIDRQTYTDMVKVIIPKARVVVAKFRDDSRANRLGSWIALQKALEHYSFALYLWENQRGMSLVMSRIREANHMIELIPKAYKEETGGGVLASQMPSEKGEQPKEAEKKGGAE